MLVNAELSEMPAQHAARCGLALMLLGHVAWASALHNASSHEHLQLVALMLQV